MSPTQPLAVIDEALHAIATSVTLRELPGVASHTAIVAEGLDAPLVTKSLGRYLTGAIAGAVDLDARLSQSLLAEGFDAQNEVANRVRRLVGDTNAYTTESVRFRDTWRNAWIAEGVAHALLVVRARIDTPCLSGPVHALTPPHQLPTEPGLDAVAIYSDGDGPVVAIGETKASREAGSAQLTVAARIFTEVDAGEYGADLRSALVSLRRVLPDTVASRVSDALWREHRCYMPFIFHETSFNPLTERPVLARLKPVVNRRRLLALRLNDFHAFFDSVADAMRAAVPEIVV